MSTFIAGRSISTVEDHALKPSIEQSPQRPRPLTPRGSLVAFAIPTVLLFLATRVGMNWSRGFLSGPDILNWFLWGKIVFAALFAAAIAAVWIEQRGFRWRVFAVRFRLGRPTVRDILTAFFVFIGCGLASGGIFLAWQWLVAVFPWLPKPLAAPPFVRMEPVTAGTTWLLLAWLPLFFFNITGEELWWRGYLLPRQEQHGKYAWLIHGLGLALFHLPLGLELTVILTPYLFGLPWVVSRQKNLWCGFIVHGLLNGGGFLAVALGLV